MVVYTNERIFQAISNICTFPKSRYFIK
uniref:Uncharacterized protein n=1 Tax=Ciona intestinalis TaxID=7719 RepID=H2XN27_CIOIN